MSYHDWIRLSVLLASLGVAALAALLIWRWHASTSNFVDLRDLLTVMGKDKKQHLSRAAIGELVALFATTSGYLSVLAIKPDTYAECTAVYGGIWAVRGGFSTYLRSKTK